MKKYVFITMNISGINGAEQYIYNKVTYLEQQGYAVYVFSGRPGEVLIPKFREYEHLTRPALRFYPSCLNKKERMSVLDWMCQVIGLRPGEECVIESSNVTASLWGEMLAEKLDCKHLIINLTENPNCDLGMRRFLEFKMNRHELSGIFDHSVSTMLKQPDLPLRPDMRVRAYCSNVVQDVQDDFSQLFNKDADLTIGSLGRLEKEYVPRLVEQLVAYFNASAHMSFNLLMIGGCADKNRLSWIKSQFSACKNVTLILTGAMYPISRSLIKQADLFISASGSASATYYEKIPTISIDHVSAEPKGIIGYDYELRIGVPQVPLHKRSLTDCITEVAQKTVQITYLEDPYGEYNRKMRAEFERELTFGEESQEHAYYDAQSIRYTAAVYRLCTVVCHVLNSKITYAILEMIRKAVRGFDT